MSFSEPLSLIRRSGALVLAMGLVGGIAGNVLPAAAGGDVRLPANTLPGVSRLTPVGAANPDQVLTIGVGVARPDPRGEDAALKAIYDPASSSYHQFFTPASFAARFGVEPGRRAAVADWLRQGGLDVFSTSAAGDLFMVQGTVRQVQARFRLAEHAYSYQGRNFVANDQGPEVPANLRITTVMGLNTWQHAETLLNTGRQAHPSDQTHCLPAGFCVGTLQAEDMWAAYDLPAQYRGEGQKLAILGEGVLGDEKTPGSVIADLRQYEKEHNFPQIPVTIHCVIKGDCGADTAGSGEWDLDEAAATGMAPNASHLDFYFAQDLSDADQAAMVSEWLKDPNGSPQANASFAECEQGPYNSTIYPLPGNVDGNSGIGTATLPANSLVPASTVGPTGHQLGDNLEAYMEPAMKGAAMLGRSLFAGAGDTGSGCTAVVAAGIGPNGVAWENYPLNGYPTGNTHVVSVGGTVLYTDGSKIATRQQEYSWPYTGGGSSPFLTAPDFQQGVANIIGTCLADQDGNSTNQGQTCRGVPDISALSGDVINGYAVVFSGKDSASGGTSLSGPLMMGVWARIQQASGLDHGLGFADYTYYAIGRNATRYAKDFYDVTTGFNGIGYCGTGPCAAQAGWDYTSGWGVPDAGAIAKELTASRAKVSHAPAGISSQPTPAPPAPSPAPPAGGSVKAASQKLPNTSGDPGVPGAWLLLFLLLPATLVVASAGFRLRLAVTRS